MNTQLNTASESRHEPRDLRKAITTAVRPFYWSVRRELWENRAVYIAPVAAAGLFIVGFVISAVRMRLVMKRPLFLLHGHEVAPALIMGTAFIVGVFYCLDALYGERRDRSILFWKSLPVSDATTVISKLAIPILILPLLSFIVTVITQFIMVAVSSAVFAGSGANIASAWSESSFIRVPAIWLYHLVTVHGLWYAPLYAWLLLVSAWAPRAPFLWAFLPPFVVYGVEKIAFNTSYFLNFMEYRLAGPQMGMAPSGHAQDSAASLIPHHFFAEPGLWTGLAVAGVLLYVTVQLRRSRGPI
jgi:ABC-2 type transport system permease protein